MTNTAKGSCLCGAVTFELTFPTKFFAHCHCSMCRRAHGAPFVSWTSVKKTQLAIDGAENLTTHASSDAARRKFCKHCGSPMFFESTRWSGEVHIAAGCIQDRLDRPLGAHVFVDHKADWLQITDELPEYGGLSGTEPLAKD